MKSRRRSASVREYRGTFAFRKLHESAILHIYDARERVDFEARLDGEPKRIAVILTDLELEIGFAFFQGEEVAEELTREVGGGR